MAERRWPAVESGKEGKKAGTLSIATEHGAGRDDEYKDAGGILKKARERGGKKRAKNGGRKEETERNSAPAWRATGESVGGAPHQSETRKNAQNLRIRHQDLPVLLDCGKNPLFLCCLSVCSGDHVCIESRGVYQREINCICFFQKHRIINRFCHADVYYLRIQVWFKLFSSLVPWFFLTHEVISLNWISWRL